MHTEEFLFYQKIYECTTFYISPKHIHNHSLHVFFFFLIMITTIFMNRTTENHLLNEHFTSDFLVIGTFLKFYKKINEDNPR